MEMIAVKTNRVLYIILALLVVSTTSLYSQTAGTHPLDVSAMRYLYPRPEHWSGAKYSTSKSVFERLYVVGGATYSQLWRSDNMLDDSNSSFGTHVGVGINLAPVHSLEVGASWINDGDNCGLDFSSVHLSYLFNLSAYAMRIEDASRFELFAKLGVDTHFKNSFSADLTSALRLKYNLSTSIGLYVEPGVSVCGYAGNRANSRVGDIRTSLMVGATINLFNVINSAKEASEVRKEYWAVTKHETTNIVAIKSNLLYDVATLLNIGVEVPIKDRFSISGDFLFPWWQSRDNALAINTLSGTLEGRYWFGDRNKRSSLEGIFAGVYTGAGYYDLRFDDEGYQGEFFVSTGLSCGYAHKINKRGNLRLEYNVGFGYMSTNYKNYKLVQDNDILLWQHDGCYNWIGPTKVGVSLVWLITGKKAVL